LVFSLAAWPSNGQLLLEVASEYANAMLAHFLAGLFQAFVFYPKNHRIPFSPKFSFFQ